MLVGSDIGDHVYQIATALGFKKTKSNRQTGACVNEGVSILWHEEVIILQELPSYDKTMHIQVTVFPEITYHNKVLLRLRHTAKNSPFIVDLSHNCQYFSITA